MHQTLHLMKSRGFPHLRRKALDALQVNLGYKCNQACFHCHVNASPDRKEMMSGETIDDVIAFMRASTGDQNYQYPTRELSNFRNYHFTPTLTTPVVAVFLEFVGLNSHTFSV